MNSRWLIVVLAGLAAVGAPAPAQQPDYLTDEEVEKVRATQEPNKRIALFLEFSSGRLLAFEKALAQPPGEEPPDPYDLKELLGDFIRAVDDTAGALEAALERGGADLRKARAALNRSGPDLLARLERLQQTEKGASEDLRYDLEDAVEATQDLVALAKKIPNETMPPKGPTTAAKPEGEKQQPPPPGRPTLKRRTDPKPP